MSNKNGYKIAPIIGYEGHYEVDSEGNIYSLKWKRRTRLKCQLINSGYYTVDLWKNNKNKKFLVHRVVAEAFIPNPNCLPQINHKDENRLNNNVENLEWCTAQYNSTYGHAVEKRAEKMRGRHEPEWKKKQHSEWLREYWKEKSDKYVVCVNDGKVFHTYNEAAREYHIERHYISKVCRGKQKSVKGLVFKTIRKDEFNGKKEEDNR